jgi:hypothetical protein
MTNDECQIWLEVRIGSHKRHARASVTLRAWLTLNISFKLPGQDAQQWPAWAERPPDGLPVGPS